MKYISIILLLILFGCAQTNNTIDPPSPSVTQKITQKPTPSAAPIAVVVGECTTKILDGQAARDNNLQIAAQVLTGMVIDPNIEFSFNTALGQRTKEKGYKEAPIIVDGHKEYADGGGICQISSTLYQAAKNAGLEILERHDHTKDVGYLPKGEDAAVSYGSLDMRFKNNTNSPLQLHIEVTDTNVTAKLIKFSEELY